MQCNKRFTRSKNYFKSKKASKQQNMDGVFFSKSDKTHDGVLLYTVQCDPLGSYSRKRRREAEMMYNEEV